MITSKLVKYGGLALALVFLGQAGSHLVAQVVARRTDDPGLTQVALAGRAGLLEETGALALVSVEKSAMPKGQVEYGDELTYTLVISATPGAQVGLYDPLTDMTFARFVEQPLGVTYADIISGSSHINVITGTLTLKSTNQITVSFVVQAGWAATVTNRACVYPFGGTLGYCVWSDEVSNVVSRSYTNYLPLALRAYHHLRPGYYVDSVNGSDVNPGTSADRPWRTLAPVHDHDFLPGDMVHFKRGSSWTGKLVIDDSGEEGNPIIFTTFGAGDRPVFRNPGDPNNWTQGIVIEANWVVVEGLLVRNVHRDGIYISAGSNHNIIRDVQVNDAGIGIRIGGQYNLVTGNYIHDLHMVKDENVDSFGAVGCVFNNSHNEASYNTMVRCIAPSIQYGTDGGGFELFSTGACDDNYIHHNWVIDSDMFLEMGWTHDYNNVVAYNVHINNSGRFLHSRIDTIRNLRIENNTIIETGPVLGWVKTLHFSDPPDPTTCTVRNNIFYIDNDTSRVFKETGCTHDHNLYYLGSGVELGVPLGQGEMVADPLFANLDGKDFSLQLESLAIDAGVDLGYTLDFENRPVPVNAAPDLGAFEYQGTLENEYIIDDTDPEFSTSFSQDAWSTYTQVGGQHYSDTHRYNEQIGTGEDTATWSFTVPQPGRYQVYAWWWEGSWRPTDVPYTINRLDGSVISSTIVRVDQQTNGGQWNLLGTFDFQDRGSVTVSDDVSSGQDIVADAIRLVYLEPLTRATVSQLTIAPPPMRTLFRQKLSRIYLSKDKKDSF